MSKSAILGCLLSAALLTALADANTTSPYAGQASREIKALSGEDVQDYLAGKGMGLAKAAELNGYPGPSHVLALAVELALTPEQTQRTHALFGRMEASAITLGGSLVEEERRLDQLFASRAINRESLARSLKRIGDLQAQVRGVHLETHLSQIEILTPAQVSKYMALRGYTDAKATDHPHSGRKH